MKDFDRYLEKSKKIQQAAEQSGDGAGYVLPWLMIVVGVVVTGFQTHALTYRGMQGAAMYSDWIDIAALLPVLLLEGSAIGLTVGRLYVFKGDGQRRLGHLASYAVWGTLAVNTLAMFTLSGDTIPAPVKFYTRFVLPLTIVAIPYLWKRILDLHPDSQERIAVLDSEARNNAQWRRIQDEQRQRVIDAYESAAESEEVRQATTRLVQKAALKRAAQIAGAIVETEGELRAEYQAQDAPKVFRQAPEEESGHLNGATRWD